MVEKTAGRIVFFDGVCGICNRLVNFLVVRNRKSKFRFAMLQGNTAKAMIPDYNFNDLSTVVYMRNGIAHHKSSAILWILNDLGRGWKLFLTFWIFPAFVRDPAYDFFARRRYRWFGRHDSCRKPSPQERRFFLD